MKLFFTIIQILLINMTLFGQSLFIDSLFSNHGFETYSFDHQLRNIELFNSNQGDYRIVGLDLFVIGPSPGVIYIEDYFILGFNDCGEIDSSFASQGKFSLQNYLLKYPYSSNLFNIESYGNSSGGDILFPGSMFVENLIDSLSFISPLLIKVLPNGVVDTNYLFQDISLFFDSLTNNSKASYNYAEVLDDDRIICIGQYSNEIEEGILIVKYQPSGNLDSTFNNLGFRKINFANLRFAELDILKSSDNEYIIAASHIETGYLIFIKIDSEGELVESFGSNGSFTDSTNLSFNYKLIELQGEKILVGREWTFSDNGDIYISLLRYTENGIPDSTFGINGRADVQIAESSTGGLIIGLDIIENNRILVGYHQYWNGPYGSTIVLDENGSIDSTFATGGRLIHEVGDLSTAYGSAIEIIDGRLVLAGITSNSNVILSRFTIENTTPNITIDGNMLTSGITSNSIEIQWYLNGIPINNSNSPNLEIFAPGEYVIVANDIIDCGSKSDTLIINTVNNNQKDFNDSNIYPNPANSIVYISNIKMPTNFIIHNIFGETVISGVISNNNTIDISSLENGVYFLILERDVIHKIIKY